MLVTWRYRPRKSLIQSFDPRAWIIFFLCYIACTVLFWDLRYLLVLFAMALVAVFTSGIKWHEMRRAWLFIGGFILFFSFLTLLTGRGGIELYKEEHIIRRLTAGFTLLGWRPTLVLSAERIAYAVAMMVRVFSLASMTILIPYSLNPALYGVTFRGLGLPDKVAYGMDLTMRFIPSFGRDFQLTMDAQRARGYELEKISGGLFAQVRKLAPLIVPVTIHAIVASEDIIDAMDLRAFGVGPRTWVDELHYRPRDRALIAFGVGMLLVCIALSLWGFGKFWVPDFLLRLAQ
ncbi:energy-coupling factor transporter transmembrane component T [Thermanaerothrix sp.]|jgi:energy-coupling factor transport system permease protein|uniref:energy-coupling factor transporter transmembrane component T family protein n=1 Tax=Thermanaerothrix sp. TaxID=2972675 RepID=UPI002ADD6233|nr:energy-coupling factor transporter transmembrane component T [Thermanaerothrix sp.]